MADDVEAPGGEAGEPQAGDTDVTDLPLDESPEAHIRRAIAGEEAGTDGDAGAEAPDAQDGEA